MLSSECCPLALSGTAPAAESPSRGHTAPQDVPDPMTNSEGCIKLQPCRSNTSYESGSLQGLKGRSAEPVVVFMLTLHFSFCSILLPVPPSTGPPHGHSFLTVLPVSEPASPGTQSVITSVPFCGPSRCFVSSVTSFHISFKTILCFFKDL